MFNFANGRAINLCNALAIHCSLFSVYCLLFNNFVENIDSNDMIMFCKIIIMWIVIITFHFIIILWSNSLAWFELIGSDRKFKGVESHDWDRMMNTIAIHHKPYSILNIESVCWMLNVKCWMYTWIKRMHHSTFSFRFCCTLQTSIK